MEDDSESKVDYQVGKEILDELVQKVISLEEDNDAQHKEQTQLIKKQEGDGLEKPQQIEKEEGNDRQIVEEDQDDEEEWEDAGDGREEDEQLGDEQEFDDEQEDEECDDQEEEDGDEKKELDDDEIVENPAYIPKQGKFYMHDIDRSVPPARRSRVFNPSEDEEEDTEGISAVSKCEDDMPKTRAERVNKWKHDMFDERAQGPKGRGELIRRYGRDIRRVNEDDDDGNEQQNTDRSQQQTRGARERGGGGIRRSRGRGLVVTNRRQPVQQQQFSYPKERDGRQEGQEEEGKHQERQSQQFSGSGGRVIRNSGTHGERGRSYGLGRNGGGTNVISRDGRSMSNNQPFQREGRFSGETQREGRFSRGESQQQQDNQHYNTQKQYNQSSPRINQNVRGTMRGGRGGAEDFNRLFIVKDDLLTMTESLIEKVVSLERIRREVDFLEVIHREKVDLREVDHSEDVFLEEIHNEDIMKEDVLQEESHSEKKVFSLEIHNNSNRNNIISNIIRSINTINHRLIRISKCQCAEDEGEEGGSHRSNFHQEANVQSPIVPPQQQYNQQTHVNYQAPIRGGRGGGGFGGGSQRGNFQGSMPSRAAPLPQQQVMSQYSGGDNNYSSNMSNVPPPQIPIQQPIVQHYQPQQQQQIYRQPPQQIAMAPPPLMGQQQNYPHPRQPTEPVFFVTDQQQNRMMGQFPKQERQRQPLHIEPPH
uniref:Protein CASC3 n=1 Tax=Meloidogyne enterolobii TaxID=390850 RepID=A0A6V7XS92_MELEN|nr:unnamed protein product [Meloidogyne enterolobii]CAD2202185.1 unnamed protein product [Meloidogyne enterolobii]